MNERRKAKILLPILPRSHKLYKLQNDNLDSICNDLLLTLALLCDGNKYQNTHFILLWHMTYAMRPTQNLVSCPFKSKFLFYLC